jgi:dephospho-CoA kinase
MFIRVLFRLLILILLILLVIGCHLYLRAAENLRIERVCRNKGWSQEQVRERICRQLSQDLLKSKADFIIDNNGQLALLPQVIELIKKVQN